MDEPSHARERRWLADFEINVNSRRPVMRVAARTDRATYSIVDDAMTTAWEHADVFPAIARIIKTASVESGSTYVTHDQITLALLADTEGSTLISSARGELDEDRTAEWIAHNMVAWFSQRITVGESDWADRFDRQKIDGKWAYRPKSSNP